MSLVNAPIHDLLIRIKNAYMARRHHVEGVVYSKFKVQVLDLLKRFRFVSDYKVVELEGKKFLSIDLHVTWNLNEDIPVVKFFSKPSRRRYVGWKEITSVAGGKWIGIISTSQWLMAAHEARKKQIGGELIAEIY